jgi:DNA-binding response OmpR family regulator
MPRVRILQVAYDSSLLRVRTEMLKHAGFEVGSALGNDEAQRVLQENDDYDLIVVAWSAPDTVRREIVIWLKQQRPNQRVIALHSAGAHPIAEADLNSCSENPDEWFKAVKAAAVA